MTGRATGRALVALILTAVAATVGVIAASPARADTMTCNSDIPSSRYCDWDKDDGTQSLDIEVFRDTAVGGHNVAGSLVLVCFNLSPCDLSSATVYVTQCRGDLTGCGTIAANNIVQSADSSEYVLTSKKPVASGHVYRACGSWVSFARSFDEWKGTNKCSPWIAVS